MHIPDNFLSTPVWAALDGISVPAVGWMVKRASRQLEEQRVPLLGVMGAFIFAAQMINFPVGVGTSAHLVGGALLTYTLGPAAASTTMTAIVAIQALVFQDGGLLALGANVFNMAVAGVLAAYFPFRLWGAGQGRRTAIFIGGFLSVIVSASLALSELMLSGIRMPHTVVLVSMGLFIVSAVIEGAITVAVVQGITKINPGWVLQPGTENRRLLVGLGCGAALLAIGGFAVASTDPDGIQQLGQALHLQSSVPFQAPLANYSLGALHGIWFQRTAAGILGVFMVCALCILVGRLIARRANP